MIDISHPVDDLLRDANQIKFYGALTGFIPVNSVYKSFDPNLMKYGKMLSNPIFMARSLDESVRKLNIHLTGLTKLKYTNKKIKYYMKVHFGYLSDMEDNIQLVLCVRKEGITSINKGHKLNKKNYKLFVSTEFSTDPIKKPVYNKVLKEYINNLFVCGVEVSYLSSKDIEDIVYRRNTDLDFTSVDSMNTFFKDEVPKYILQHGD